MEIIIGIAALIAIFFLVIFIGQLKGAPEPSTMSDAAIYQRLQTEGAWISKYLSLPYENRQSTSLKHMHQDKTAYIQNLKTELMRRQAAQGIQAVQQELDPILQRAADLVMKGMPDAEAHATAVKEWGEKNT